MFKNNTRAGGMTQQLRRMLAILPEDPCCIPDTYYKGSLKPFVILTSLACVQKRTFTLRCEILLLCLAHKLDISSGVGKYNITCTWNNEESFALQSKENG